jgi:hypothetical protein
MLFKANGPWLIPEHFANQSENSESAGKAARPSIDVVYRCLNQPRMEDLMVIWWWLWFDGDYKWFNGDLNGGFKCTSWTIHEPIKLYLNVFLTISFWRSITSKMFLKVGEFHHEELEFSQNTWRKWFRHQSIKTGQFHWQESNLGSESTQSGELMLAPD